MASVSDLFTSMQQAEWQRNFWITRRDKLKPSKHPEDSTYCDEDSSVLETDRQIYVIVTAPIYVALSRSFQSTASISLQYTERRRNVC